MFCWRLVSFRAVMVKGTFTEAWAFVWLKVARLVLASLLLAVFLVPNTSVKGQGLFDDSAIGRVLVEGNQRVEQSSIIALSQLQPGNRFSADVLNKATKALYASGFFADVSLERRGNDLLIKVDENAIINQIAFEGNFSVKDEILLQEMKLKPRSVVTPARVKADLQRALAVYRASGRYDVMIEPKLIRLSQNRANLVLEIEEGPKSKIRSINFIGNRAFSDSKLRGEVISRQAAWWRFLTSVDSYDPDRIGADEELLRRFYLKNGYADFEIKSTIGELRETDRTFALTFTIHEGPRYQIDKLNIDNKLPGVSTEALLAGLTSKPGAYYDGEVVEEDVDYIRDTVGDQGFAFVKVEPILDRDQKRRTVSIRFEIGEGPKIYIERVNINGNTRTRDNVLRREFRVVEGDAFSAAKVRLSRQRLQSLGYFTKVDIRDRSGPERDRIILDVDVEEGPTGALQFGATYSSSAGASGLIEYNEKNLLGRGTTLNASVNVAENSQALNLGVSEPYLFGRNMVGGADLFYKDEENTSSNYTEQSVGGSVSLGYAINESLNQNWGLTIKNSDIKAIGTGTVSRLIQDEQGSTLRVIASHNLNWQKLDNLAKPRKGVRVRLRNELAGLGGDVDYVKNVLRANAYYPLGDNFTLAWNGEAGNLTMLDDEARLSDRFIVGESKLRGFEPSGIGPRLATTSADKTAGDALGGSNYMTSTAELRFKVPNPLEFDLEGRLFVDGASLWDSKNTYGNSTIYDSKEWRASYGLGFSWVSPIGPLQLDWGWPARKEDFDKVKRFRFSIGTRF